MGGNFWVGGKFWVINQLQSSEEVKKKDGNEFGGGGGSKSQIFRGVHKNLSFLVSRLDLVCLT